MIRKQIYLAPAQDRKVKALAAAKGWTESEAIRDLLDRAPNSSAGAIEQLAAAGLLAPKRVDPNLPTGEELRKLEAEVEAWRSSLTKPIGLTAAILEERYGHSWRSCSSTRPRWSDAMTYPIRR